MAAPNTKAFNVHNRKVSKRKVSVRCGGKRTNIHTNPAYLNVLLYAIDRDHVEGGRGWLLGESKWFELDERVLRHFWVSGC